MKLTNLHILLISLLVGGVFVVLLTAHTSWQPVADCKHPGSSAQTEGCVAMEYGYPFRFISSSVEVGQQNVIFATVSVNKKSLLFNWAVLSGAVAAGIVLASSQVKQVKAKRKTKRAKRK